MKVQSHPFAFTNPRVLVALTFFIVAVFLATSAFTGVARPLGYEDKDHETREKSAKQSRSKKKTARPEKRGSMARKSTDRPRSQARPSNDNRAPATAPAPQRDSNVSQPTVSQTTNAAGQTVYTVALSGFDTSKPLTELAKVRTTTARSEEGEYEELTLPPWRTPRSDKADPVVQAAPSLESTDRVPGVSAPTTGFNFIGIPGNGSYPPDNNGSVGNDQYVETVNTRYQVWSLNRMTNTATSVLGPINISALWSGFAGGNCAARNDGDPVVVYDKLAQRWVITQFTTAAPFHQCVAISTTPDATGTFFRFAFAVPNGHFGDYPHYGVWTDAYYVMAHHFTSTAGGYEGGAFGAMDRTKMLAGDPTATWQVIVDPLEGGHMPADIDGNTPPPGNAPGVFLSIHEEGMYLYRMRVDFANASNTVRTLQGIMPIAPATAACNGAACIPQTGTTAVLASLADRLMFRVAYRNFVDHESLVVSHSVDPAVTGVVSGVRWYDFRISGAPDAVCSTYPCTYQQGTVADVANGRSRWMPSISMDGAENILVGYSTTGKVVATEAHSIRYTGRAKGDPLGTMTAPETTIINGTRNMASQNRWGDYTSMSMDPADDCTFWYVNQFYSSAQTGNGNWRTQIASSRFPEGGGLGQCAATTCTNRPTAAPVIGTASASGNNVITVNWTAMSPAPGSYAIERAMGAPGNEGIYQPIGAVPGTQTSFLDTVAVQGGVTYTYRVIAASDAAGRCQSFVRSGTTSVVATGVCNLKPSFAGATSASSADTNSCAVQINWTPATTSCPLANQLRYNIYRGTTPDFVPAPANRIATCVNGPSSHVDLNNLTSGATYYYVVRAEDNTTGNGGPCGGGNEDTNNEVVAGTPYGAGTAASPGTWTDGGGDTNGFLKLNQGGGGVWRFVKTANDPGANHTPGGSYAYRTAGPTASALYSENACSWAETPTLTVGSDTINLTYWERHQLEQGWDGVAVEYSRNGGAWTTVTPPNNLPATGCQTTDVITDWGTLACTGAPPANACADPATTQVITGPIGAGTSCTDWTTGALTAYGRRCHTLVGLTAGDTIKFRWRFISDPASEFAGFYLDDIAITNIRLPNPCTGVSIPTLLSVESVLNHGGTDYGVNIPLGSRGIEPRLGAGSGAGRNYTIVLHFDRPVNGGTPSVNGSGAPGSVTFSGNDMIVQLNNVTDLQTLGLTLTNVTTPGGGTLGSATTQIGFLGGDVNRNGTVSSTDISIAKSNSGAAITGSNFTSDVIANGTINATDIGYVKTRSGASLGP